MAKQNNTASTGSNSTISSNTKNTGSAPSEPSSESKEKKPEKTLEDLFETNLQDIYSAEMQLIEALPKLAKAAYNEDLQSAFEDHLQQTKKQAERLEKIFQRLRISKGNEKCAAMEGLIKESDKIIEEFDESPVRDSALIIGAQKVEHYEIAAYGSLCELADVIGMSRVADVLDRSLAEEEDTDKQLTQIAMDVNDEAYEVSQEEEPEEVY
jgi:ferritin-like metal-binding protein YciE